MTPVASPPVCVQMHSVITRITTLAAHSTPAFEFNYREWCHWKFSSQTQCDAFFKFIFNLQLPLIIKMVRWEIFCYVLVRTANSLIMMNQEITEFFIVKKKEFRIVVLRVLLFEEHNFSEF